MSRGLNRESDRIYTFNISNWNAYADGNPISLIDPFGLGAIGENGGTSWFTTTGVVGAAGVLEQAALVRYNYLADVARLPAEGSYSAARDAIRAFYNQPQNSTPLAQGIAQMHRWEQVVAGANPSLANPTATAAAVNNAAAMARYGGQGLIVVGTSLSVYTVATAPDPYRAMAQQGGATVVGVGGGMAGAAAGAAIGSVFRGPGTAIGAVLGAIARSIGGGIGGNVLGGAAYDGNYGPNSPWFSRSGP